MFKGAEIIMLALMDSKIECNIKIWVKLKCTFAAHMHTTEAVSHSSFKDGLRDSILI